MVIVPWLALSTLSYDAYFQVLCMTLSATTTLVSTLRASWSSCPAPCSSSSPCCSAGSPPLNPSSALSRARVKTTLWTVAKRVPYTEILSKGLFKGSIQNKYMPYPKQLFDDQSRFSCQINSWIKFWTIWWPISISFALFYNSQMIKS